MFQHLVPRFVVFSRITTVTVRVFSSHIITRFISSPSSISNSPNQPISVDFLINSCGLSPESALKASKQFLLRNPRKTTTTTNPDSVLSLFKTYGFTQPQISKLISGYPLLLLAKPDKTLKPKFEFFTSIDISGPALGEILCKNSNILKSDLKKTIIPTFNFLKSLVSTNENVAYLATRSGWILYNIRKMALNIAILRNIGVPESNFPAFVTKSIRCLTHSSDRFNAMVSQLNKIGVDPSSMLFLRCLVVLLAMKQSIWDAKMAVYKSFGWSEDEVLAVFKKHPTIMCNSANRVNLTLDFLMNGMKWTRDDVAKYPGLLTYSLERRIIPRCYVLQILHSKGLICKAGLGRPLYLVEDDFKKYLVRYQHQVPDLLKLYQSRTNTQTSEN